LITSYKNLALLLKDHPRTTECDVATDNTAGYKSLKVSIGATDNTAGCKSHEGKKINIAGENTAVSKSHEVDLMAENNDVCKEEAGEIGKKRGRKKNHL